MKKNCFSLIVVIIILLGCSHSEQERDSLIPAPELYNNGLKLFNQKNYTAAIKEFETLFLQHPNSSITQESQIMRAYSLYLNNQYDDAIDVLNMFIKLHPINQYITFAHYLKSLCYYVEISDANLDQSKTVLAKESFKDVIKKFPDSKYAVDSSLKMDLINDHLAGREMDIGRYYLNKNNPIAAIKRFQNVIKNYQNTTHTPEALFRLVESYESLGLPKEAKRYATILGYNYKKNKWYAYTVKLLSKSVNIKN